MRGDLKFCILLYLDLLQNWLNFGHGLLILLILLSVLFSETGKIWGSRYLFENAVLIFGMLMYPDHHQNRLRLVYGLLIFLILGSFWLSGPGGIWGFPAFSWEYMREVAWYIDNIHWPPTKLIRFWSYSVGFLHFGTPLTCQKWSNLRFPCIFLGSQGRMTWHVVYCCMLTTFRTD